MLRLAAPGVPPLQCWWPRMLKRRGYRLDGGLLLVPQRLCLQPCPLRRPRMPLLCCCFDGSMWFNVHGCGCGLMKQLLFLRRYVVPWYRAFRLHSFNRFLHVPVQCRNGFGPKSNGIWRNSAERERNLHPREISQKTNHQQSHDPGCPVK